jgi:glutathione S-transferase
MGLGVADVDDQEHPAAKYGVSDDARMTRGELTLYVVPASHPCAAVELALQRKGLAYRRVDLLPMWHVVHQRVVFGRRTVPGLKLDGGERVSGSRAIMRVLESLEPEPPLLPGDAALRAKAEAAEAWGDEVLQPLVRRVLWAAAQRRPDGLESYSEGSDLPIPASLAVRSAPVLVRLERLLNRSTDGAVRADLAALDGHLDRADAYVSGGVIGAEPPNVADLQIASSLRLLMTLEDLRAPIEARPSGQLALRLFPGYPGRMPSGSLPPA